MYLPGEPCERSNDLLMDRVDRASSDTSIFFHLGIDSAIKGSTRLMIPGETHSALD